MEFNFNSYDNSKQSISYCEVDKCKIVIKLKKCLQEIKEIGETCSFTDNSELLLSRIEHILEKISEVEDE